MKNDPRTLKHLLNSSLMIGVLVLSACKDSPRNIFAGSKEIETFELEFEGWRVDDDATIIRDDVERVQNIDRMVLDYSRFSAGSPVTDLAVGDFNGDGRNDVAASHYERHEISVWLNKANGEFQKTMNLRVHFPQNMAAADFNEDGKLDLVVISEDGYIVKLHGKGDGLFETQSRIDLEPGTIGLRSADLNNDGHSDIVVPNYLRHTMSLLLGNGDGTFQMRRVWEIGANTYYMKILDLDHDGDLDIASVAHDDEVINLSLNEGEGRFWVHSIPAGRTPLGIDVADIDNNGFYDFIVTGQSTGEVRLIQSMDVFSHSEPRVVARIDGVPMPLGTFLIRFDENRSYDLVVANYNQARLEVFLGTNDRNFERGSRIIELHSNPQVVARGDFNGDLVDDLATGLRPQDGVELLFRSTSKSIVASIVPSPHGVVSSEDGSLLCGNGNTKCYEFFHFGAKLKLRAESIDELHRFVQWGGINECHKSSSKICEVELIRDQDFHPDFAEVEVLAD